jgi:predicted TIM-barrel fold metal-dependent hydrolase
MAIGFSYDKTLGGNMKTSSRRDFLVQSASAASLAGIAQASISGAESEKGWIDAHVHVWTPNVQNYPLDKSFQVADMQPPSFTAAELLEQCRAVGVDRVVLIQMSFYGFDHRYLFDVMRAHPGTFSAVALIDHRADNVVETAKELVTQGARGFRLHSHGDAKEWVSNPSMQKLWKAAPDSGYVICPLINPQDIASVDALCKSFPDTTVVVDHFARIGLSGSIEQDRLNELCQLARFPNVYVKTSAFYALGQKKMPYHDLKPMIRRVFDAFGPQRLMWATDCPYQVQGDHTYRASIDLILKGSEFLSDSDKNWILRDTANKVFFL